MLACRGSEGFLPLSIELYGTVSARLLEEAEAILADVPAPGPEEGPWLDADGRGQGRAGASSTGTAASRPTSSRTSRCGRAAPG